MGLPQLSGEKGKAPFAVEPGHEAEANVSRLTGERGLTPNPTLTSAYAPHVNDALCAPQPC